MTDPVLLVTVVTAAFTATSAQLFPFSSLRSYIDQHHSESRELSTNAPPPVDNYRYLQEAAENAYFSSPAVAEDDETERTVLVTPKPKYVPQRVVPEPKEDPNSPNIPSMGFSSGTGSGIFQPYQDAKDPLSSSSIGTPVRSVTIEKPAKLKTGTKYEPVLLKETPSKTHYMEKTVVDSVPSLSVTIPVDGHKKKSTGGLIDYLVPPKFPSVYETHMKTFSPSSSNLIVVDDDVKGTTAVPVKTKKKKKNKNKGKGDSSGSGSEKRLRVRTRPPSSKTKNGEPLGLHASATEIYLRPPQSYRPPHISTPHPIEEQIAAETNFGLGGTGGGERVEFQLHGQSGPETYKFGFDTGDGKNRHFRYEEKDHVGNVKGHYGYYDKTGKLQVVNYHADKHGFHASSP